MSTASQNPSEFPRAIAVIGASSTLGSLMLMELERSLPDCQLVAIDDYSLTRPVKRVSAYRMEPNRTGAILTIDDIPEVMQSKAWDLVLDNRRLTIADAPDVFHLESVDSVIHVGSHYDRANARQFMEDTQHWVQACRLAGLRQFVYLSDIRVYGAGSANPIPVTERSPAEPAPEHRFLLDAESTLLQAGNEPVGDERLKVAVLRTAMSVGPAASSPVADELLWNTVSASRNGDTPLQLVHQHDLTRAVELAINRQLDGIYNVASNGTVGIKTLRDMHKGRPASAPRSKRRSQSSKRHLAKNPLIVSDTKLRQAAGFKAKYSSEQAARAYCHSYLLEPSTRYERVTHA